MCVNVHQDHTGKQARLTEAGPLPKPFLPKTHPALDSRCVGQIKE